MTKESALSEMGIQRPEKINHYLLRSVGKDKDVLTIYYKRKKNSFRPQRKTYSFGRSAKMVKTGQHDVDMQEIFEISPFVQRAVAELDALLKGKQDRSITKKEVNNEIEALEKEFKYRISEIKQLLKECD